MLVRVSKRYNIHVGLIPISMLFVQETVPRRLGRPGQRDRCPLAIGTQPHAQLGFRTVGRALYSFELGTSL